MSSLKLRFIQILTAVIAVIVVLTLTNAIITGSTRVVGGSQCFLQPSCWLDRLVASEK
jgi:hypothetical protein